jgi:heme-degrading monooxygenase HmoA
MHARITTVQIGKERRLFKPNTVEESLDALRLTTLPKLKKQKGFKEFLVLIDRAADKVVLITIWESEDDMIAIEASGFYKRAVDEFSDRVVSEPRKEYYEVAIRS